MENLIFAGGGIKCLAFIGALEVLDDHGHLTKIKRVIGSSAGAMVAVLVACKFTPMEIYHVISTLNFTSLLDNSSVIRNLWRLIFSYGYYDSWPVIQVVAEALRERGIPDTITFQEVYEQFGTELVITGTCLNKRRVEYFCRKTHPDMSIILATKISASLPIFFEPVEYQGNIYTDGAVLCGMPIHILKPIDPKLKRTIGLSVICDRNKGDMEVSNLFEFVETLMYTMSKHAEKGKLKEKYLDRIVTIHTKEINTTDFTISQEAKENLVQLGRNAMNDFLIKHDQIFS